jgi:hypothetical protein
LNAFFIINSSQWIIIIGNVWEVQIYRRLQNTFPMGRSIY